jgi:hypothetical protein
MRLSAILAYASAVAVVAVKTPLETAVGAAAAAAFFIVWCEKQPLC